MLRHITVEAMLRHTHGFNSACHHGDPPIRDGAGVHLPRSPRSLFVCLSLSLSLFLFGPSSLSFLLPVYQSNTFFIIYYLHTQEKLNIKLNLKNINI